MVDRHQRKLIRVQAARDGAWAEARGQTPELEAYLADESNDPLGRKCAAIVLADLKAGDYLTSTIADPDA